MLLFERSPEAVAVRNVKLDVIMAENTTEIFMMMLLVFPTMAVKVKWCSILCEVKTEQAPIFKVLLELERRNLVGPRSYHICPI